MAHSLTTYLGHLAPLLLFVGLLGWEALRPCTGFQYPETNRRLKHGVTNLLLGFIGTVLTYVCFLPLWAPAALWSRQLHIGLLHFLPSSFFVRLCVALLLLDIWTYWWHRMNHRVQFLWRFHRAHHSDPFMDVTTARRFHPVEIVLSSLLRIPLVMGLGLELHHIVLYDAAMLGVVLFHHANVTVSPDADQLLRLIIPTPVMHKIHHSRLQPETDSNYGAMLSLWDRCFGSYRLRRDWQAICFGLDGFDTPTRQDFMGLVREPWIPVARTQPKQYD